MTEAERKANNRGFVMGLMLGLVIAYWLARYSGL